MDIKYKKISILGSTGSIGTQALEVIDEIAPDIKIQYLSAHKNISILEKQALKYQPAGIIITDKNSYDSFKANTKYKGKIYYGSDALSAVASDDSIDLLISAIVGFAGVLPAYYAILKNINLALANKEALVSAGEIISKIAKSKNKEIIPIDSEHSAIYQCLAGENKNNLENIILTASGGPFRKLKKEDFKNITLAQALAHPNWSMGNKITIDSATMMNKGFEVIEAIWLFDLMPEQIKVLIHPQSIVHSMVQFRDSSIKAQLGSPDMKLPIAYALTAPERKYLKTGRINLAEIGKLTFESPDLTKFKCLELAYHSLEKKGNSNAILNTANDTAVSLFLSGKIHFTHIPLIIEDALNQINFVKQPSINDIILTIEETKNYTLTNYISIIN